MGREHLDGYTGVDWSPVPEVQKGLYEGSAYHFEALGRKLGIDLSSIDLNRPNLDEKTRAALENALKEKRSTKEGNELSLQDTNLMKFLIALPRESETITSL